MVPSGGDQRPLIALRLPGAAQPPPGHDGGLDADEMVPGSRRPRIQAELGADAIELYADTSRQLRVDPDGREMLISCGAALKT